MADNYTGQDRGSAESYSQYYAGMDKTMRQKVALICSHFPSTGKIADMGSGSGRGSWDLANLYPELDVVGVDISPESVAYSSKEFSRKNLSFRLGDIADPLFEKGTMDGFLNSSVLHHVTSFNGFSVEKVLALLDHQSSELKPGGILAIRDFVVPDGPEEVLLELPESDGTASGNPEALSSAHLFELFCRTFKCAAFPKSGIPHERKAGAPAGWARFRVDLRRATEFLLRKDYRKDWEPELLEEYLYFSQERFEREFRARGLRILLSRPIYNSWIISRRWQGKAKLSNLAGEALQFPPTNYMIIGQKCEAGEGVELGVSGPKKAEKPRFLQLESFRERSTGRVWDLVSRPHPTLDLIPWFERDGELHVVARGDYPRPIVQARPAEHAIERLRTSGYIVEPLTLAMPEGTDHADAIAEYLRSLGLTPEAGAEPGLKFFPSPGSVGEMVEQYFVEVKPPEGRGIPFACHHGFKSRALLRALEARQTLRAYQAGGMVDHRLELGIYALFSAKGRGLGPWIGEEIDGLATGDGGPSGKLDFGGGGISFDPTDAVAGFLEARAAKFRELDCEGKLLAEIELEYVVPSTRTLETLVALPYWVGEGGIHVGLELRSLPAVQKLTGSALLPCLPAWRLKDDECARDARGELVPGLLSRDFGVKPSEVHALGSPYFPSPGTTPEACSPYAARVKERGGSLKWVPLGSLLRSASSLRSGHLLAAAFRLAHAASK